MRVENLREEVARLAEVLEAAEIELDRRVIAREELVEALAVSTAESTAVSTTEAEEEAAPSLARVPGSTVPPWREGLPVTVLAPDYQRILGVPEQQRSLGLSAGRRVEHVQRQPPLLAVSDLGGCGWRCGGRCPPPTPWEGTDATAADRRRCHWRHGR